MSNRFNCFLSLAAAALLPRPPARATDADIGQLLRSPVGKDWVTNGRHGGRRTSRLDPGYRHAGKRRAESRYLL